MARVSVDDIAAYRDHGAVCLRGLFAAKWLELLAAGVEKDKADPGPLVRHNTPEGNPGEFFVDFRMWRRFAQFRRFVFDLPAPEIAASAQRRRGCATRWLGAGLTYAARRVAAHRGPRARARRPGGGRGVAAIRGLVLSPGALPGPRGVP